MHLHLDCQFGMAGDMLLAALVDAGADAEAISETLGRIPLPGFRLDCRRTSRNGIAAVLADVVDLTEAEHVHGHTHGHGHDHTHDHGHEHVHDHAHEHAHKRDHAGPHRHLADLLALLDSPAVPPRARERAAKVFRILAEAEATVHGLSREQVHFHEISGIDTAVDVIGSCLALEHLDASSVTASAPAVGRGMLACAHGIFPLPAPATLEILKTHNIPWRAGGDGERTTPTGAALLAGLADSFGDAPEVTVTRIGYGAGHKEFPDVPNLLRAIIGKPLAAGERAHRASQTIIAPADPELAALTGDVVKVAADGDLLPTAVAASLPADVAAAGDRVMEFRFVLDDMTPEAVAYLCERAFAAGALEAYAVPAVMKKGRAGHEVTVLASAEAVGAVADTLWRESTTFGMRVVERGRLVLARESRTVLVLGHEIRVKFGWLAGELIRRQPEYEDCRAVAAAEGRAFGDVYALAGEAARALEG